MIKKSFEIVQHHAEKKSVDLIMNDIPKHEMAYYNAIYGDESRFL